MALWALWGEPERVHV